jgi:hypothetical protein
LRIDLEGDFMAYLAPWEIEENERWKSGDFQSDQTKTPVQPAELSKFTPDGPAIFPAALDGPPTDGHIDDIDPQTAEELKRLGEYESFLRFYKQIMDECSDLAKHLKKVDSPIFRSCEIAELPQRYDQFMSELNNNWRKRKESARAVKQAMFLATELIKVFPMYKFLLPLKNPLRLIDCMRERLDSSQTSLVIAEIKKLPYMPYKEPYFLNFKCRACDRLISLYFRAGELENAIDVCDCGMALESTSSSSRKRFVRAKNALVKMLEKRRGAQNSWSSDDNKHFKSSAPHHAHNAKAR